MPTIQFEGSGGIMEGDFGTADIIINQASNFKSVQGTATNQQLYGSNSLTAMANPTKMTAMAWVKQASDQVTASGTVVMMGDNFRLLCKDGGGFAFELREGGKWQNNSVYSYYSSGSGGWNQTGTQWLAADDGSWHHIAATWDDTGEFTQASCVTVDEDPTITHPVNAAIVSGLPVHGTGIPDGAFVLAKTDTTHFTITYDGTNPIDATASGTVTLTIGGGIARLYADGTEVMQRPIGTRACTAGSPTPLLFAKNALVDDKYAGEIMDVKLYADKLSDADVLRAASKINADPTFITSYTCRAWYKLDNVDVDILSGGIQDSSGAGEHGVDSSTVGANLVKMYDNFSVNAQDTVTTNGTFTVTQGKLECLSLSSVDFEKSAEKNSIALASTAT